MNLKDKIGLTFGAVFFMLIVAGAMLVGVAGGRMDAAMDRASVHGMP